MQRSAKNNKGSKSQKSPMNGKSKISNKSKPQASASVAYATSQQGRAPNVVQGKDSIRVRHREFISTVTSSVAFAISNAVALNPGLSQSFPWLSQVAQAWEEYSFNSLTFEYVTRASTATTGSVILTPDYDASDSPPVSEQIACSYDGAQEDASWKDQFCNLPSGRLNSADKFRYVRTGPLSANQDIKLYDAGNFFVCCTEFASAAPVGKLWVEYDVTLKIPALSPIGLQPRGGLITAGGTMTSANPFGDAPVVDADSRGIAITNGSVITFAGTGDYSVTMSFTGTVITGLNVLEGAGITLISQKQFPNAAATGELSNRLYRVTDPATSDLTITLVATTVTAAYAAIGEAPPSSLD